MSIKGKVVLTFDDVTDSQMKHAVPILKEFGFTATFFACGSFVSRLKRASLDVFKSLATLDFEVGNHLDRHYNMIQYPVGRMIRSVVAMESMLKQLGLPHPETFCYPGFHHSIGVRNLVRDLNYKYARAGQGEKLLYKEPQVDDFGTYHFLHLDSMQVDCIGVVGDYYRVETYQTQLDQLPDHAFAVFCFHDIRECESSDLVQQFLVFSEERFRQALQDIKDRNLEVIQFRDMERSLLNG